MTGITLTKALKLRKKLIEESRTTLERFKTFNSREKGNATAYDAKESWERYLVVKEMLVDLKTKIHLANAPIYRQLFRMSELKGINSDLLYLTVNEGKFRNANYEGGFQELEAFMNLVSKDKEIQKNKEEIETLQGEIEEHNAKTKIEFEYKKVA